MKVPFKPGTLIYPLPAVMVSCGDQPENYNILTIAWTGTVCSDPPMCYISVRHERHSYEIIKRTGEFVINLTTEDLARATDWCGVRSLAAKKSIIMCHSLLFLRWQQVEQMLQIVFHLGGDTGGINTNSHQIRVEFLS